METIILILSGLVFLYFLHYYVRDDFIIFRKNVTLEDIFNGAFLTFIIVFLSARLFYVLENPSPTFINPLVFLAVFYYPGLSLTGGVVGGIIFQVFYLRKKRFPAKRILDFFSIAALWSIASYFLLYIILFRKFTINPLGEGILFLVLLLISVTFLIPKYLAGKIKDGFLAGFFCLGYSLVKFISLVISKVNLSDMLFESIFLVLIFFSGLIFILREQIAPRIRDLK